MKTLSLKLPDELAARVSAVAKRMGSNKSEILRNALEAYLENEPTQREGSALEVAGDLAGALEGPKDLSHQDSHMHGYGK